MLIQGAGCGAPHNSTLGTEDMVMRWLVVGTLLLISQPSFADSYTLVFDSKCSTSGRKLEFSCQVERASWAENLTISGSNGKWFGREESAQRTFPLGLIKNDEYVMIFDYPVLYSGIATIVLIKRTGRFYMSEISYSGALGDQNATIEAGRFTERK